MLRSYIYILFAPTMAGVASAVLSARAAATILLLGGPPILHLGMHIDLSFYLIYLIM